MQLLARHWIITSDHWKIVPLSMALCILFVFLCKHFHYSAILSIYMYFFYFISVLLCVIKRKQIRFIAVESLENVYGCVWAYAYMYEWLGMLWYVCSVCMYIYSLACIVISKNCSFSLNRQLKPHKCIFCKTYIPDCIKA